MRQKYIIPKCVLLNIQLFPIKIPWITPNAHTHTKIFAPTYSGDNVCAYRLCEQKPFLLSKFSYNLIVFFIWLLQIENWITCIAKEYLIWHFQLPYILNKLRIGISLDVWMSHSKDKERQRKKRDSSLIVDREQRERKSMSKRFKSKREETNE